MKQISILLTLFVAFYSCQNSTRYTQQSAEIDVVKEHIKNYNTMDYDLSLMADNSVSFFNSKTDSILRKDLIAHHQANDAQYSSRGFLEEDQEFEMVVTDDGNTWVNAWLDWRGTLKGSNKTIDIPIHLTYKFENGKITRELGYWDPTEIADALRSMAEKEAMSVDEKMIDSAIDAVVKAWNDHDTETMKTLMATDMTRTENGSVLASSAEEYGSELMSVFFQGFPDFKVSIDEQMIVGNQAIINWTCTGTNTGDFQGLTTNKPITTHGVSIWTFNSDGKASREDAYYDNMTLFEQLGSMPEIQ